MKEAAPPPLNVSLFMVNFENVMTLLIKTIKKTLE